MLHERKRIRLAKEIYLGGQTCFVTVCCQERYPFFRDPARADGLFRLLRELSSKMSFLVHAYCIMPDHLHLLVAGQRAECDLIRFIQRLKAQSAFEEKRRSGREMWQRSFYDHIVRPHDSPECVAWYIWMNPVRKCLASTAEAYPYSGSFTSQWKRSHQPATVWTPPWKHDEL